MNSTWPQLLFVQIGGAICLPVLLIGFLLGRNIGLQNALLSILIGNSILALMACFMSYCSIQFRKTTPELAQTIFGNKASWIFSAVFLLNLMGWFGINLLTMAEFVSIRYLSDSPLLLSLSMIILGIMIVIGVLGGIVWLERMAKYLLPFLLWGMVKMSSSDVYLQGWHESAQMPLDLAGVSLVFSALFACVVDMPTYFCRARSLRDGIYASLLLFLVVVPGIEILGLGIASSTGSANLASEIMQTSSGYLADIFLVFFVVAGWTTNNCNIFSAQNFLDQLLPQDKKLSYRQRIVIVGSGGIVLGLIGSVISFENLLLSISSPLLIASAFLMVLLGRKIILERSSV